jgi:hypothetical protein
MHIISVYKWSCFRDFNPTKTLFCGMAMILPLPTTEWQRETFKVHICTQANEYSGDGQVVQ